MSQLPTCATLVPRVGGERHVRRTHCAVVQAAKDAEGAADKLRLELITLKTRMGGSGTGSDVVAAPEDGRHTPLQPSKERDTLEPELAAFLKKARTRGLGAWSGPFCDAIRIY